MTGYVPGAFYSHDCRSCGHTEQEHDAAGECIVTGCACPGWQDQPISPPPIGYERTVEVGHEQWVMPMHAAQRLAMICDDLAAGRDVPYSGPASLLQYLPPLAPRPPCAAIAPISGHYYCVEPQGHRGKHHVTVGEYNPYDVLWKTP